MKSVLLLTNVKLDEPGGRAEKFATRKRLLEERGYRVVTGYVTQPYTISLLPTVVRCWRLARREDVDVINSISSPFHIHLIGYIISRFEDVPWLAEIRDPIGRTSPDRDEDSLMTSAADTVERLVATRADQIVWSDGIQMADDYLVNRYDVLTDRFHKLPFLGFESSLFENSTSEDYSEFTITYAGSFYEGWIEPYGFLDGLAQYTDRGGTGQVQFYGDWNSAYQQAVEKRNLESVVETYDRVTHEEIVPVLKGSDALLYVGGNDPENRLSVPSKIWDYIGARSPIIAVVDPSFRVAELIRKNGLGIVVDPDDAEGIADALEAIRSGDFEYDPDESVFTRFSREHKMDEFANVLNAVSEGRTYGSTT